MTREEVAMLVEVVFKEIHVLREAGQREYAHEDDNAFRNFHSVSTELEVDVLKVLLTYFLKHKDGVVAYAKGHRSQRENVRGRINDMIVYLILLRGLIEEAEGGQVLLDIQLLVAKQHQERKLDAQVRATVDQLPTPPKTGGLR